MQLPKQLKKENIESEVQAALDKETIPLFTDSDISIPLLTLNKELRTQLFYAKAVDELVFGYDTITKFLANELQGLQKMDNQASRVSRLLLIVNNAKEEFYRDLEILRERQGERLLICRLDVDTALMGKILGFKTRNVNAVLLSNKTSVTNVLKTLLSNK